MLQGTNNTAALTAAKNDYKKAVENCFARTGETYSDSEKAAISNYGETLKDGMYGWSKNDLANALKESLVYDCNVIGVIDIGMNGASFVRDPVVCRNGRT